MRSRVGRVCAPGSPSGLSADAARAPVPRSGGALRGVLTRGGGVKVASGTTFLSSVTHVAGAVRSGAGPAEAWWHGMGVRTDDGVPRWEDLVAQAGPAGPEMSAARAVHAAARLSAVAGTAPAAMLDRVVDGLVRDAEEAAQRRSAIAGPQTTARLLAWLPALGLLLGLALGADPAAVLLDGGGGSGLLLAGGALTAIGHEWGRRYVRAAVAAAGER